MMHDVALGDKNCEKTEPLARGKKEGKRKSKKQAGI